jgi:hypothetical protein
LVEVLNAHAELEKLRLSRDSIDIINDSLLHGKMENIKIKLASKSVS